MARDDSEGELADRVAMHGRSVGELDMAEAAIKGCTFSQDGGDEVVSSVNENKGEHVTMGTLFLIHPRF